MLDANKYTLLFICNIYNITQKNTFFKKYLISFIIKLYRLLFATTSSIYTEFNLTQVSSSDSKKRQKISEKRQKSDKSGKSI